MELNKEKWDKKAKEEGVPDKLSFIFGVNACANAVETKINEFREELKKELIFTDEDDHRNYGRQAALEELLEKLTNLTPTTNE